MSQRGENSVEKKAEGNAQGQRPFSRLAAVVQGGNCEERLAGAGSGRGGAGVAGRGKMENRVEFVPAVQATYTDEMSVGFSGKQT